MEIESLKAEFRMVEQHIQWCKDNNKPQEHIDAHTKILNDIKEELKELNQNKDE